MATIPTITVERCPITGTYSVVGQVEGYPPTDYVDEQFARRQDAERLAAMIRRKLAETGEVPELVPFGHVWGVSLYGFADDVIQEVR